MRFEEKSHTYARHARVQRDLVAWGLENQCEAFAGKEVLEFGAGTGLLTGQLLECGAEVTATDLSCGMVAEGIRAYPRARWQVVDAWEPESLEGEMFDVVTSSALLQWAGDAEIVLKNWIRYAREGGKLCALIFAKPSLPELEALCPEAVPLKWRTTQQWKQACEGAGWRNVRIKSESRDYHYPDSRAFFRELHGIGATAPGKLGAGRLRSLMRAYDAEYGDDSGVRASWTFLRLEGERA